MARIELSNIGGGGTTLSLTTTGTSGASTLAGSVLNIPVYQGQLTLTTTGTSGAATLSGDILNIPQYSGGGGGGTPAGSAGQVQFNSTPAGSFAASANLAWDDSNVRLNIGAPSSPTGRLNIKGTGTTSGTINTRITNSGNTELVKVLDNGDFSFGTVGSGKGMYWDNTNNTLGIGAVSPTSQFDITNTQTGTYSPTAYNVSICRMARGNSSGIANQFAGFAFQVSSDNFNFNAVAQVHAIQETNASNNTSIAFQLRSSSGYFELMRGNSSGNLAIGTISPSARLHIRGSNTTAGVGALLVQNSTPSDIYKIENNGKISYLATNTAAGTTGPQTIDRPSGTVNFGIGASALVVTNSLCTTSSIVFATVRTNDATAYIKNVVPAAGSFTINLGAAATAETSVGFFIIN